MRKAA
jgi:transcriptional regulator with XRE-family HTH domain